MKKRLFAIFISLLLLLALCPAGALASGEILVNLNAVRAGDALDLLLGTTDSGEAALDGGALPDGCAIVTEQQNGRAAHYLRGTPMLAGGYEFRLTVKGTEPGGEDENLIASMRCELTVLPALPSFQTQNVSCFVGDEAALRVQASVSDGGRLGYQWYSNDQNSNLDGRLIEGAVFSELIVSTDAPGVGYYYCVITNDNNGMTSTVTTPVLTVQVEQATVCAVRIESLPYKQEYTEGDELDPTGLTLRIEFTNGTSVIDGDGFTLSPMKLNTVGSQTVTVEYENYSCSFSVLVKEEEERVVGVTVMTLPAKREYKVGEWINTQGLTLQVITNKNKTSEVSTGFSCSPQVFDTPGLQTVTVTYGEQTTSFTVTVTGGEKKLQAIEVQTMPTKLSYHVGESFDASGLVLKAVTDQGEESVRSGFTCSPARFSREGTQTVVISYGNLNCTLEVEVLAAEQTGTSPAPASSASPAATAAPRVSQKPETATEKSAFPTAMLILFFAGIGLLGVLIAMLVITYKPQLQSILRKLRRDGGDEDDEADEDDENDVY